MNIHHLELFYYVARHGGISEAVRKIPYGIQQPAVSAQVLQLERSLGTKLFRRQPFRMTPEGERLYEFIRPFFGGIDSLGAEIQAGASQFIRIGASGPVLRHHLPVVLQRLRKTMPRLRLSLLDATAPQLIQSLKKGELDLAVTTLDETPAHGLTARPLVQLPLNLLVPRTSRIGSVKELWKLEMIDIPLISLPAHEPISAHFQRGLQRLGVDWPPTLVVSSLELIETYVAKGFGFGATVFVPGVREPAGLRRLPVEGFESLSVGALWAGRQTELIGTLVSAFETYVRKFDRVG